jgi:hypothetical protein
MSQNAPVDSDTSNPSGADQPPSNPALEGAPSDHVGETAQRMSEVSDILTLTADQDKAYAGFDPAVHAVGADGKPLAKKGGGWQRKRGRRPGDAQAPTEPRTSTIKAPGDDRDSDVRISNEQASLMVCALVTSGMQQILGPAWAVTDKNEKESLVKATRAYLDATGGLDLSPGTGLMFAWAPYAMQRLPDEETQSRLKKIGLWFGGLFRRKSQA